MEFFHERPVQLDTIVLQGLKDGFDTGESIEAPNAKVISLAEKVGNSWEVMEWMVVKCGENGVGDVGIWIELVKFLQWMLKLLKANVKPPQAPFPVGNSSPDLRGSC